jgi:hypothetical protein
VLRRQGLDVDQLAAGVAAERLGDRRVGRRDGPERHAVVHPLLGDNCGATPGSILRATEEFTLTDAASPATRGTTNGTSNTVTVTESSTVSWKVVFDSSDLLVSDSVHCEKTSLTIAN